MVGWFKALGVSQRLTILLAVGLALVSIILLVLSLFDASLDQAKDAGVLQERAATSSESQHKTEKANAAVNDLRNRPAVRDEQCLRYSDTPQNC